MRSSWRCSSTGSRGRQVAVERRARARGRAPPAVAGARRAGAEVFFFGFVAVGMDRPPSFDARAAGPARPFAVIGR
jgi:hypothetical protein